MAQEQVRRENREQEETPPPPPAAAKAPEAQAKEKHTTDDEELDRLLDEVDRRLEENPEEFLAGYKQRGGE